MQPKPTTEQNNLIAQPAADLCESCVHRDDCHLRQMPTGAVHDCSEYDDGTPVALLEAPSLVSVPAATASNAEPEKSPLKGLCVNCDHRETCTLKRPAGGVWHCEEYQ